jgi:hypothetical protein
MIVKIVRDDDPPHPRKDWDNLGTMLYCSSRYTLGDEQVDAEVIQQVLKTRVYQGEGEVIVLPVYAYIHGGIALNTTGFSCVWDSGMCGCILVSKAKVRSEWKVKRISQKLYGQVINGLKGEVQTYAQYLEGDVWGYIIQDDNGEQVDACYGFFGQETAQQEADMMLKHLQTQAA